MMKLGGMQQSIEEQEAEIKALEERIRRTRKALAALAAGETGGTGEAK